MCVQARVRRLLCHQVLTFSDMRFHDDPKPILQRVAVPGSGGYTPRVSVVSVPADTVQGYVGGIVGLIIADTRTSNLSNLTGVPAESK